MLSGSQICKIDARLNLASVVQVARSASGIRCTRGSTARSRATLWSPYSLYCVKAVVLVVRVSLMQRAVAQEGLPAAFENLKDRINTWDAIRKLTDFKLSHVTICLRARLFFFWHFLPHPCVQMPLVYIPLCSLAVCSSLSSEHLMQEYEIQLPVLRKEIMRRVKPLHAMGSPLSSNRPSTAGVFVQNRTQARDAHGLRRSSLVETWGGCRSSADRNRAQAAWRGCGHHRPRFPASW